MPVYYESRKNRRNSNQDYYLSMEYRVNQEAKIRAFLVADGMGGLDCAELVSSLVGEKWMLKLQRLTISPKFLGKSLNDQIDLLTTFSYEVVEEINREVYRELSDRGIRGGSTLTTGILFWDTLIVANCGDSPAYYYNKKKKIFRKLSREQNKAEELYESGKAERGSMEYIRHKNMLTDYIGKYRKCEPHVEWVSFQEGDRILIGSDGAFGNLREAQIEQIFTHETKEPQNIVREIMLEAEKLGEEDNQTLIFYTEETEKVVRPCTRPSKKVTNFILSATRNRASRDLR